MIPKIIHFCWFSKMEYPQKIQACMDSWGKYLSDYVIRKWTMEDIKPLLNIPFVKEAIQKEKWAFAADYVRLYALYTEGGIYLDSDVEVFSSFDPFLDCRAFLASEAWDNHANPEAAIFGSEPKQLFLKEIMQYYETKHFVSMFGALDLTPSPVVFEQYLKKYGYQSLDVDQTLDNDIHIYSSNTFTNTANPKKGVVALHRFTFSWIEAGRIYRTCKKLHIMPVYYWYRGIEKHFLRYFKK